MKLKYALMLLLVFFVGCTTGRNIQLTSEWAPLIAVEEGTDKLFAEGMTTTIGHYCYVADLAQWQQSYPEGSVEREALLRHEQLHAKREFATGLPLWLAQYVTDKNFRWHEEQLGYEQEIRWMLKNGRQFNPQPFAVVVSHDYKSLGGQMCTYDEALQWANDLLAKIASGQ